MTGYVSIDQSFFKTGYHNMTIKKSIFLTTLLLIVSLSSSVLAHSKKQLPIHKVSEGLSVMVLGSGGPVATNKRVSAGYLILIDGKASILMDVGGGVHARLGASGANIKDLEMVLLSHLHIDHTGDLDATIKALFFQNRGMNPPRTAPIHFLGPDAPVPGTPNVPPPSFDFDPTSQFINGQYAKDTGLLRYLHFFSKAICNCQFNFATTDIPYTGHAVNTIYEKDGIVIKAVGVTHGPVPSVAYRIEYQGKSLVYTGDTTSLTADRSKIDDNLVALAQDADLLIYDTAILDDTGAPFNALHTRPTDIGKVAAMANVKHLVLSHITPMTEPNLHDVKHSIHHHGNYYGPISIAKDLRVYNLHQTMPSKYRSFPAWPHHQE